MTTVRKRTAELLEAHRPDDPWGRVIDGFLILLILGNVALAILITMPDLQLDQKRFLFYFELFSIATFSTEYLLRLWSCPDKRRYAHLTPAKARLKWALSPLGLIDLMAIAPFWVMLFFPASGQSALLLRVFRGMRLLRVFKLTRYSPALSVLLSVLREEARTLLVVAFILMVILLLASWGIYIIENDRQPDKFGSIPLSMWWAVVSLTTVGYGDVVPLTPLGKFFAGIVSLVGIGMMALPAGILASGFASEMRRREHAYNRVLSRVLEDGFISKSDAEMLESLREELGLSEEEAHSLLQDARRLRTKRQHCPHCGKSIHEG